MYRNYTVVCSVVLMSASMFLWCSKEREPQHLDLKRDKVVGVVIRENSVMRIDPIIYSARVALLKRAEMVEVLDKSREQATVGGVRGYWYKVKAPNGITGWVWGKNIHFFKNESKSHIESYVSSFWEKESERVKKLIAGRWWSVDKRGDFTNHALEITPDGKYKSYLKGGQPITGDYNINFKDNEIVFTNGTTFKLNLNIVQRGTMLYLEKETEKDSIKFQKTSGKLDEEKTETAETPKEGENAN